MAENKTKATKNSVSGFLKKVSDKGRRDDCLKVSVKGMAGRGVEK